MITPTPKIALEEHFMAPGFEEYFARTAINLSPALFGGAAEALADFGERRLSAMDQIGVEKAVLSLAGPGVQAETDTRIAGREASEVNDFLAERMRANPARYGGFAHLAMQAPRAAADELERCVRNLGMQGALVNGAYLDDDRFAVFWERAAGLSVPVYIHPANPPDGHQRQRGGSCME